MLPEQASAMTALGAPRYALFALIHMDPPVRAWTGVGDFEVPADDVDLTGGTYLGIGQLIDVPALRQLIGGAAERVELALSGIDETTFALADEDADAVRGAYVSLGVIFFDQDWQSVAPIAWLWDGAADTPSLEQDGAGGQVSRRVTLSVGSAFTDRTRARFGFYTAPDQKARSPSDTFCDRVAAYTIGSTVAWPSF